MVGLSISNSISINGSGISIPKPTYFIIEVDITLGDGLNQMRLPIQGTQPMTVDWGDGTIETVTQTALPSSANWVTHSYASGGVYEIKVSETLERVYFNNEGDKDKLTSILNWGDCVWTNFRGAFFLCVNNKSLPDTSIKNIENVTDFEESFRRNEFPSIPQNILKNAVNAVNYVRTFAEIPEIDTVPKGIFDNSPNALLFVSSFQGLQNLSIPEGLFNKNINANRFDSCFFGTTLPVNDLSRLYIELSVFNTQNNVPFHGGLGQYDPNFTYEIDGVTYTTGVERSNLITRGWTLTDGGAII